MLRFITFIRPLRYHIPAALIILLQLLSSFSLPPLPPKEMQTTPQGDSVQIFVVSNGVHTDLVLPAQAVAKNWKIMLPDEEFKVSGNRGLFVAFGWGNKDFYINTPSWSDLKLSTAVSAAFGLGSSAMHVRYLVSRPVISDKCVPLNLSMQQYKQLVNYVEQSFCLNGNCAVKIDHPGYGANDLFFEARGKYSLFRTCNVWTNNALRAAGIRKALWTPTADGLIRALR